MTTPNDAASAPPPERVGDDGSVIETQLTNDGWSTGPLQRAVTIIGGSYRDLAGQEHLISFTGWPPALRAGDQAHLDLRGWRPS